MKINDLNPNVKYLVAVSGGSDSMALLDMCRRASLLICVAHMNYQLRQSAIIETKIVEDYCQKYAIPFFVRYQSTDFSGNFQLYARKMRYAFFRDIFVSEQADILLSAHHQDDHIETYIFHKLRHSTPAYWGISTDTLINGMSVKRVLLDFDKADLRSYCINNNIPFHDDESNSDPKYTRNWIRQTFINKLNRFDKQLFINEITLLNKAFSSNLTLISELEKGDTLILSQLTKLGSDLREMLIRRFIASKGISQVSKKTMANILLLISDKQRLWSIRLSAAITLRESYGELILEKDDNEGFTYTYDKLVYEHNTQFALKQSGALIEGCNIGASDFPITIRSPKDGDRIVMRYGSKSVARFLIDRKIDHKQRKNWIIIENSQKQIIFVQGIGCEKKHFANKMNLYVVKL